MIRSLEPSSLLSRNWGLALLVQIPWLQFCPIMLILGILWLPGSWTLDMLGEYLTSAHFFLILHTPGRSNPADPASQRPDCAPREGEIAGQVILLTSSNLPNGLTIASITTSISSINLSFSLPLTQVRSFLTDVYLSEDFCLSSQASKWYCWQGGLWWFWDCLYVPLSARPTVLSQFHDLLTPGHTGVACMLYALTRTYLWPVVQQDVIDLFRFCDSCQQVKINPKPKAGTLIPPQIPDRPWSDIGNDFIVNLPLSSGCDLVFVITDHLQKGAHFIAYNKAMDLLALAHLFVREFFRLHGFLKS